MFNKLREAIKKESQSWNIVPNSSDPPTAEPGTPYLVKNIIIALIESTIAKTNSKQGFLCPILVLITKVYNYIKQYCMLESNILNKFLFPLSTISACIIAVLKQINQSVS